LTATKAGHIVSFSFDPPSEFQAKRCEMKWKVLIPVVLAAGALSIWSPLFAHHGAAAYDMSKPVILKDAVVTKFSWINPHPLIAVDYKDENGNVQHWTTEMGSTPASQLIGWTRTTLKRGDVITIYIWQSKTGVTVGRLNKVIMADGTVMRDTQRGADDGGRADTGVRQ
jgi:hypothetical protein